MKSLSWQEVLLLSALGAGMIYVAGHLGNQFLLAKKRDAQGRCAWCGAPLTPSEGVRVWISHVSSVMVCQPCKTARRRKTLRELALFSALIAGLLPLGFITRPS
jgi:hypothetical protein